MMNLVDLSGLLLSELKEVAKKLNIEKAYEYKKIELIEKIADYIRNIDGHTIAWGKIETFADGYGFLRETNVEKDVYISSTQIRRFKIRNGDMILGEARVPTGTEKNYAMRKILLINGDNLEKSESRVPFDELTPAYPEEKINLGDEVSSRIIDLVAPIGKGQRGLIVAPPKAGKTMLISNLANSIIKNNNDLEVWILLIDERPEEVTDIKETVIGAKVFSSTFDEDPKNHIKVTEMVLDKAKRILEDGKDVVILMDSITRLARAYNIVIPSSGKLISGGIDPTALYYPKKFFGSARNIRGGGSLTILATALVDTGSRMDDVIFEEFKGTGNMDIHLDRTLAELRIYPAIDIKRSGTRKEEMLTSKEKLSNIWKIRRYLNKFSTAEGAKQLIDTIKKTKSNDDLLEYYSKGDVKN
ncbi:MAG: transcription termination factor Rho [Psychrilyobacter sp.]|nr:transcription termination factor Rho [Psychrilyobacter sp.]